ncbi:MAG: response regulator [Nitrospiraceae bacterium]|nr:MAG: response regulator [Nitrospiraceae bacterium]
MNSGDANNILVVDDDPYVLESLSSLLQEYGYNVIACKSGEDAVLQLVKCKINLVLTDIKMPGMSGIDLLAKIHDINPKMPVILMTGYAELDIAINAIKKGAFDFVTKPYNPDYILHTIDKARKYTDLLELEEDYKHRLEETVRKQTQQIFYLSREVIKRLTAVAEFRDTCTGAHISRMGLYANKIAESLNMSIEFIDAITYASSLHDIGKIGIPDSILLKPGAFTPEEFETMKAHTTIGHNILAGSTHPVLQMAASVALNHHERWDGTGYPRKLKGEDIPVEGRIVIICDQYDALMGKRPYKPALSHEEVFQIITKGDGRTLPGHFDPEVMNAFNKLSPVFKEIYESYQD